VRMRGGWKSKIVSDGKPNSSVEPSGTVTEILLNFTYT
jgi:hypothetical protein